MCGQFSSKWCLSMLSHETQLGEAKTKGIGLGPVWFQKCGHLPTMRVNFLGWINHGLPSITYHLSIIYPPFPYHVSIIWLEATPIHQLWAVGRCASAPKARVQCLWVRWAQKSPVILVLIEYGMFKRLAILLYCTNEDIFANPILDLLLLQNHCMCIYIYIDIDIDIDISLPLSFSIRVYFIYIYMYICTYIYIYATHPLPTNNDKIA